MRTAARDPGSADAFERLYKMTAPLLLGVARRIVGRLELAEEVLHDSFAKIWQLAGTFDPLATRPVAWMVAIARNRAIDLRASREVSSIESHDEQSLFDWSESAEETEERRRNTQWVHDCLSRLQPGERQALVLAYQHGLSHGELARQLAKPLGTVKTWVRRGLANLRECVEARMAAAR